MAKQSLHLEGAKALDRKLRSLGDRVHRKVSRQAVNAAATPVVKAAKAKAAKAVGHAPDEPRQKLATFKKTATVAAIVGARKSVTGTHDGKPRKPSRYAHLVEKGHIDQHGNHVPPKPFLRPALDEAQGAAMSAMTTKLAAGVEREARKAAS